MAHPYHWDVIGWMSDILSWKRDEIIAYYRTFYSPNNAVIVVCRRFPDGDDHGADPQILRRHPQGARAAGA